MTLQVRPGSKRKRGCLTRRLAFSLLAVYLLLMLLNTGLVMAGIHAIWWLLTLQGVMLIIFVLVYVRWRARQEGAERQP